MKSKTVIATNIKTADENYSLSEEQHEQYVKLMRYIHSIMNDRFFGKVKISFQNGKIIDIKEVQTFKINEL